MNILVINCGSSSLKYQIIETDKEELICKGLIELSGDTSTFAYTKTGCDKIKKTVPLADHTAGVELIIKTITDPEIGCIKDLSEIGAVGHRMVHGGEDFASSVLVNDEVLAACRANADLAPIHNPANIAGIEACKKVMPDVPMAVVFDTAFHQTMPPEAYLYAIPYEYYTDYKIRKYGFHGTSHLFVSQEAARVLGKKPEEVKVITCHIGNGGSCAAVEYGKCIDTSMGLTPIDGLVMGTRCGDIDPSVVTYLMHKLNISADEVLDILNKKSGFLGVSGVSNDCRFVEEAAYEGNERAAIAMRLFSRRVKGYIGNYLAQLNGADALVFTAGIGENDATVRADICEGLTNLGFKIDPERNHNRETIISTDDSEVTIMLIPTNEELVIARDTARLVSEM
ncbi:MAG: acetate kinase [Anaerovoracaceae bacterium]|nr:acetate kinase [Anaerovoracaceae bacterium]